MKFVYYCDFRFHEKKILNNIFLIIVWFLFFAGCDTSALTKAREERLPAAVWTLFHPADGDKIRDFLNKGQVSEKRPLNYDPVTMDNNAKALNEVQLKKLKDEYDVKPYVIAQFPGEALFIPAGSLRQVSLLCIFLWIRFYFHGIFFFRKF